MESEYVRIVELLRVRMYRKEAFSKKQYRYGVIEIVAFTGNHTNR